MKSLERVFVILIIFFAFSEINLSCAEKNTINISGQVIDLKSNYIMDSRVILSDPAGNYGLETNLNEGGTFHLDNIPVNKEMGSLTLQIEAAGFLPWTNKFFVEPGETLEFFITLAPSQSIFISILMGPALLGLISWVAILVSRRSGKILAGMLVALYLGSLILWVVLNEGWIDSISGNKPTLLTILLIVSGLVLSILTLIWLRSIRINRKKTKNEHEDRDLLRSNAVWFAGTATTLWVFTIAGLLYGYDRYSVSAVAIFHPALSVPFAVPVFAFIGILVYTAANIRESAGFATGSRTFRKKLMVLGERILVGPYIAIVAYFILVRPILDQIKVLSDGAGTLSMTAFLAFFSGLYVKQVMNRLEQIGISLLTGKGQEKLKLREDQKDELVDILGLSDYFVQGLYDINISSIDDLSKLSAKEIEVKAKTSKTLSKGQLQGAHEMACRYLKDLNAMQNILKLNTRQINELRWNQIASIQQLSILSENEISELVEISNAKDLERFKITADAISELRKNIIESSTSIDELLDKNVVAGLQKIKINTFGDISKNPLLKSFDEKSPTNLYKFIVEFYRNFPEIANEIVDLNIEDKMGDHDIPSKLGIDGALRNDLKNIDIKKYGDIPCADAIKLIVAYNRTSSEPVDYNAALKEVNIKDLIEYMGS